MIGQKIQNYQVDQFLGEGGMGAVYRASDTVLGRDVALKMLHSNLTKQGQFLDRFKNEAQVLAKLNHPNIAVLYNYIQQDETFYMVMEYVAGKNLEKLIGRYQTLSPADTVAITIQALEGLSHAHKKGVFHRDIKPANLILTPEGNVKLMDFGIAKVSGEQRLTQVNRVVGTLEFMAPELIQGHEPSEHSDLYSIGVMMYEMLSGRLPFVGKTDFSLMQDIINKLPPPLEKINKAIPKALCGIIQKALEKNPSERFTDAKDFQQSLQKAYPKYKEINLDILTEPVVTIAATQFADIQPDFLTSIEQPQTELIGHTQSHVLTQVVDIPAATKDWQLWLKQNWHIPSSAAIGLGAFYFIAQAFVTQPDTKREPTKNVDSSTVAISTGASSGFESNLPSPSPPSPSPGSDDVVPDETPSEKPKPDVSIKPTIKPKPAKEEKKPQDNQTYKPHEPSPPPKEESKPKPTEEENKKVVPKSIFLSENIEVELYLKTDIDPNTSQEGQTFRLTVQKSVNYGGATIVKAGASAQGYIKKLTSKKISLVFEEVTAANGQELKLKSTEFSGKFEDILQSKLYIVQIQKGVTINF
jgi:serine/threonine protein kinase